jgi:hypothetical protein
MLQNKKLGCIAEMALIPAALFRFYAERFLYLFNQPLILCYYQTINFPSLLSF